MENVLVLGGAGYIGSHTARSLEQSGYRPIVFDNLSRGHRSTGALWEFVEGDIRDTALLEQTLRNYNVEAVIHFAAFAYVGESVESPDIYYENNVLGTLSVLNAMRAASTQKIVFSSSCTVYGLPIELPITEDHPTSPISPYGQSKRMCEQLLADFGKAYSIQSIALRYFNAAGAHPDGDLGELHDPETHLIPLALDAARPSGQGLKVFGSDYPTEDGTAIRDYVHVSDLADAHVLSLARLENSALEHEVFNIGSGTGYSVLDVVNMVEKVSGSEVLRTFEARRAGDPSELFASIERARIDLRWEPRLSSLENIIETAYRWSQREA